jgi:hypothetical protein
MLGKRGVSSLKTSGLAQAFCEAPSAVFSSGLYEDRRHFLSRGFEERLVSDMRDSRFSG